MRNEGRGLARRKERSPLRSFAGLESLTLPLRYGEVAGLTVPSKTQRAEEGRSLRSSRSNLWRACWAEEWPKMTFWQENYGFIKEVYDTRYDLTSLFEVTLTKAQSINCSGMPRWQNGWTTWKWPLQRFFGFVFIAVLWFRAIIAEKWINNKRIFIQTILNSLVTSFP